MPKSRNKNLSLGLDEFPIYFREYNTSCHNFHKIDLLCKRKTSFSKISFTSNAYLRKYVLSSPRIHLIYSTFPFITFSNHAKTISSFFSVFSSLEKISIIFLLLQYPLSTYSFAASYTPFFLPLMQYCSYLS